MMPKLLINVALVALLTACAVPVVKDEGSSASRVGVGSRFVLHQSLTVPDGQARVFIQGGRVMGKIELNQYLPHCNFEVEQLSDGNTTIEPDTFNVTGVATGWDRVVAAEFPLRLAADTERYEYRSHSPLSRTVRHRLHSPRQPGVMSLTCHGGFDEPALAEYPSVRAIRQALGELVSLELKW